MRQKIEQVFAPAGLLESALKQYSCRPQQLEFALSVADAIHTGEVLVAEAGTGTGKTFAYLVPVFLSEQKALISTGTKTLQEQLFHRDLPTIRNALGLPLMTALLKGRSNYLCHYHLELAEQQKQHHSRATQSYLHKIQQHMQRTQHGDKVEVQGIPESDPVWGLVTSTRESCLGTECPYTNECFVNKARREAQEADIVVINHALFMADLVLREEGVFDLLPHVQTVVFDEAHQLPDVATNFLGESVAMSQIQEIAKAILHLGSTHAPSSANWLLQHDDILQLVRDLRLSAIEVLKMPSQRCLLHKLPDGQQFYLYLEEIVAHIRSARQLFQALQMQQPEIEAFLLMSQEILLSLDVWLEAGVPSATTEEVPVVASEPKPIDWVRWVENTQQAMQLHAVPLSVASLFAKHRKADQAWILTSATLSVNGDFQHFNRALGLYDCQTKTWESPFNYYERAILYVPNALPQPNAPEFHSSLLSHVFPLMQANPGGCMILCTSLAAVDKMADLLEQMAHENDTPFHVLRQGQQGKSALISAFKSSERAVLVASASFWEGVDLPGLALTMVIIDRLPFSPPDEPIVEARVEASKRRGGNPFMEFQIPDAAIQLKQGVGRLIRSETDWGVLVVGDARLVEKNYGKLLWQGLPNFQRTRLLPDVLQFMIERQENDA